MKVSKIWKMTFLCISGSGKPAVSFLGSTKTTNISGTSKWKLFQKRFFCTWKDGIPKGKSFSTHHFQGLYMYINLYITYIYMICIFPAPLSESQRYTWWCTPSTSASSKQGQLGFQRKKQTPPWGHQEKNPGYFGFAMNMLGKSSKKFIPNIPKWWWTMVIHHGTIRKKKHLKWIQV